MESPDTSKFSSFERADFVFSRVGDDPLAASVLRPKKVSENVVRQLPVLVFWHGGGFVVGNRVYEPWWSDWSVNMCYHIISGHLV